MEENSLVYFAGRSKQGDGPISINVAQVWATFEEWDDVCVIPFSRMTFPCPDKCEERRECCKDWSSAVSVGLEGDVIDPCSSTVSACGEGSRYLLFSGGGGVFPRGALV